MADFRLPRRGRVGDDSPVPDDAPQSSAQPDETALLRAELTAAEARIAALEQIIKSLQRARFGQSSERVEAGQLALELGCGPLTP